eukprot:TRINITY_DN3356_c0_g1_i1.p1 TRINITY_DN3356_c0_g1~~TRINITY_DN3356_c0_g1_i1.p1  ORF type:complete len:368 (+),score=107.58 TRINITY_DN3356_c0_g1_i1:33-1136(+)
MPIHGRLVIPEVFRADVKREKRRASVCTGGTLELPSPISSKNVSPISTPPVPHLDELRVRSVVSSSADTDSQPPSPPPSPPATPRLESSSIGDGDSTAQESNEDEPPIRKTHSTVVVSCHGDYTEVSLFIEQDGHVNKEEVKGMLRLPSVTGVLQNDTEEELLNPIKDLSVDLNDSDILITACSSVKSDVLDGVCDRMKFARFKRSASAASKADFIVMSEDEEVRSVWHAVLKFVPEADCAVYLGDTVFGVAGHDCDTSKEFKGDEALLHYAECCEVKRQEGLVVVAEPLASLLHSKSLEYDEPYLVDDVHEVLKGCEVPQAVFLSTILRKLETDHTCVQLNKEATWSVGAFVEHHEDVPPPPPLPA